MRLTELFVIQLEREAPITRRVLERVPEGRNDWKPHPKSMPLGYLSSLVAMMPSWIEMAIARDELDLKPRDGGNFKAPENPTASELVKLHDAGVEKARTALRGASDDFLQTRWRLLMAGKVVQESPRHAVVADTFTHLAHHRGQMSVYLRLNDVLVPSIYGPTADDKTFG